MEFNLLLADQIGQHLKSLRKLRGLSQAQLGQRLGVGQARVAAIEANPGAVSVEQLLRVFQVLGVDLVARVKPTSVPAPTQVNISPAQHTSARKTTPLAPTKAVVTKTAPAQTQQRRPASKAARPPQPGAASSPNTSKPGRAPQNSRSTAAQPQGKQTSTPQKGALLNAKGSPTHKGKSPQPGGRATPPIAIKKNKGQW